MTWNGAGTFHKGGTPIIIQATYVSVWDDGMEVRTLCMWDTEKRLVVEVEAVDVQGIDMLTREYVELSDGTEIDVDSSEETDEGIPAIEEE